MSKYALLWDYVQKSEEPFLQLTFAEIEGIAGIPIVCCIIKKF